MSAGESLRLAEEQAGNGQTTKSELERRGGPGEDLHRHRLARPERNGIHRRGHAGRVLDAARELNYQPNLRARGLRQRSSRSIGLIIPNLLNAYYTALADAVSQLLAARGYHLLLSSTRDDAANEQGTINDMVGQAVDGLVWVPTSPRPELLADLRNQQTPAVSIIRRIEGDPIDTVVFEDFAGSQAATRHLIDLGHQRIGYIGGDVVYSSNHERWQGFLSAMKQGRPGGRRRPGEAGNESQHLGNDGYDRVAAPPGPPVGDLHCQ